MSCTRAWYDVRKSWSHNGARGCRYGGRGEEGVHCVVFVRLTDWLPCALKPWGAQTQPSISFHGPSGMRTGAAGMSKEPGTGEAEAEGHTACLARLRFNPACERFVDA